MTKSTSVYLAYPIDQAGDSLPQELIDTLSSVLSDEVDVTYTPGNAFSARTTSVLSPYILHVNTYALAAADVLVAVLPAGLATIGVPIEIDRAVTMSKPVIILTDTNSWNLQYNSPLVFILPLTYEGVMSVPGVLAGLPWDAPRETQEDAREALPVLVGPAGRTPSQAHYGDAGLDLFVASGMVIPVGKSVDIPCDVKVALPEGVWGFLVGRSSTLRNSGIMVMPGIIDTGYRGELFITVTNQSDKVVLVEQGDRLAQLILLPNMTDEFLPTQVEELPVDSTRGEAGFGSTGR